MYEFIVKIHEFIYLEILKKSVKILTYSQEKFLTR